MPSSVVDRVAWVDIVKGVAIVLVVIHHAAALAVQNGLAGPVWIEASGSLRAFRMPLFFFASGLFAGSVVRRSWSTLWRTRLALLLWMTVLWAAVRYAYFSLVPMPGQSDETSLRNVLLSPVLPFSALWFLQALLVFLVIAKAASRVPAWMQITVAAVASCLFFSGLSSGNLGYDGMGRYALFFFLALHLRAVVVARMRTARPLLAGTASAAFVIGAVSVGELGLARVPGVMTVLGLIGVSAGILVARLIAATPLGRPLSYIGRNTLPVYVTHVILVAAGIEVSQVLGLDAAGPGDVLRPLAFALVATGVPLVIARGVRDTAFRLLYELPGRRRRAPSPTLEDARAG